MKMTLSGMYNGESFLIEVSLLDSSEFSPPVNQYMLFDITFRARNREECIDISDFTFYFMQGRRMYNSIEIEKDYFIWKYIQESGTHERFYGKANIGKCANQSIILLFEQVTDIYSKDVAIVFNYKGSNELHKIILTY